MVLAAKIRIRKAHRDGGLARARNPYAAQTLSSSGDHFGDYSAMPSETDVEEQWRSLAAEARILAGEMTDLEARRIMLSIAAGYDLLADHAKVRKEREKKFQ